MKQEHINEIKAILILAIGMILLASFVSYVPEDLSWYTSNPNIPVQNLIRISGAYIAGSLFFMFGLSAYMIIVFLFFWSWNMFFQKELEFTPARIISCGVLFLVLCAFLGLLGSQDAVIKFHRSGFMGDITSSFLVKYLGAAGAFIVLAALGLLSLILTGELLVRPILGKFIDVLQGLSMNLGGAIANNKKEKASVKPKPNINFNIFSNLKTKNKRAVIEEDEEDEEEYDEDEDDEEYDEEDEDEEDEDDEVEDGIEPKIRVIADGERKKRSKKKPAIVGHYTIPSLDLLEDPPEISTDQIQTDLMKGAKLLEETLANFGVMARVADIERGPAITRYELEPAAGVKVQKFTALQDDIALAMQSSSVRIVAPIPGKNRVGIEVPNGDSAAVYLKDVLSSDLYQNSESKLTLCLGKDIAGKPMVADLAEMPHLLIAGTTGSGKTVCVNGIIMSMLMNASPDELKFVMVDPKMVEMAQYNDIPHLLCPTVTDSKKAAGVLNWVVLEMENRYKKLSKAGVRNIKGYNAKGNKMPYIVVIIDELADLMQVAAKGVEGAIARLAQLSRAVGIHLILATQRPSVNVITGVIKANFPARISFKVASKVDSRTVLDMNGAETLLGKGDMLFIQPGDAKPTRGQGNYVKDEEISRVIQYIRDQQEPAYDETILQSQTAGSRGSSGEKDEYYDEAVRLVIETNQASVSILQRRMRLGYTRAARLIDMMEEGGIVGPYVGSKPRDILVDREQWLLDNAQGVKEDE